MSKFRISVVNDESNEEVLSFTADDYQYSSSAVNGTELHASAGVMVPEKPKRKSGGRPKGSKNAPKNGTPEPAATIIAAS